MAYLPLANILHHKLRSALSALGIGISVCMLVTLAGLSRGSINEVLSRWAGLDADLIVYPSSTNLTMASGGTINLAAADRIAQLHHDGHALTGRITPAYLARLKIGRREHNVFGIRAEDFPIFQGRSKLLAGRLPDSDGRFGRWIAGQFAAAAESGQDLAISSEQLADQGGLEMAVDTKLAAMLDQTVGGRFVAAGHTWRIVGVFEAGVISRAVAPMSALQYLCNSRLDRVTLLFVDRAENVPPGEAVAAIRQATRYEVAPKQQYEAMLMQNMSMVLTYVDAVNVIALVIAFLFIMVTLYTMVLQRRREIAILKSMGGGAMFLLRQVLAESMLLTAAGVAMGVAMSFGAAWAIERFRSDLTVTITAGWVVTALIAAGTGGLLAGLYPAWQAARVDVAESLTFE